MSQPKDVAVLVVGGGSTGWAAAGFLAETGRSVHVVERREEGGARWINHVPTWCFEDAGLATPEPPERWGGAQRHAFVVQAARGSRQVRVATTPALHVDMRHLVGRLRERAIAAGAKAIRGTVDEVTLEHGRLHEVLLDGGERVRPRLGVDASGLAGALRRRVPDLAARCPEVLPLDTCMAAQFQHRVRDPDACRRFLAQHDARPGDSLALLSIVGGFSTLTLFTEPSLQEIGVLTGSIPATGAPSGAEVLREFVDSTAWIGERLYGGQGAIPLRRPYPTLALSGVALVGDAACQVYSSHGSGVGMGLLAARALADATVGADDPGAPAVLAGYQRVFQRRYGGLLAGADAFRRLSQSLSHDDVARLIDAGLIDARSVEMGLAQRPPELEPRWMAGVARRALSQPAAALGLAPTLGRMAVLQALAGRAPRSRSASALFDRAIARLVGPTPEPPE